MDKAELSAKRLHEIRNDGAKYTSVRGLSLDRRELLYELDRLQAQITLLEAELQEAVHTRNHRNGDYRELTQDCCTLAAALAQYAYEAQWTPIIYDYKTWLAGPCPDIAIAALAKVNQE